MVRAYVTGLCARSPAVRFVAGFEAASWGYADLGDRIRDQAWITSEYMARTVAFLVILVSWWRCLRSLARTAKETADDRLVRSIAFSGGVWICPRVPDRIVLLMAATIFTPQPDVISNSVLRPYLFTVVHDVSFLIPISCNSGFCDGAASFQQDRLHRTGRIRRTGSIGMEWSTVGIQPGAASKRG